MKTSCSHNGHTKAGFLWIFLTAPLCFKRFFRREESGEDRQVQKSFLNNIRPKKNKPIQIVICNKKTEGKDSSACHYMVICVISEEKNRKERKDH